MLIAVFVLSIGLLGVAGLQVATAKYRLGSGLRATAASLFSDYTDRVRLNTAMAGPNSISGATAREIPAGTTNNSLYAYQATWTAQQAESPSSSLCDGDDTCTPYQRATYDMLTWRKAVRSGLPQGAAFVEGNRQTGIMVTLMWYDKDYTDKSFQTDDRGDATKVGLVTATQCDAVTATVGMALQTCCPNAAAAPEGVRCNRFSFMP